MSPARTISVALLATTTISVAHHLCFEAQALKGWLPFLLLGLGPVLGYAVGAVRSATERAAVRRWTLLNGH